MTKKFYKNIICLMAIALSYFLFSKMFFGRGVKNVLADDPAITPLWGFSGTKSGTEITLTGYTNTGSVKDLVIPNAADFRELGGEYSNITKVYIGDTLSDAVRKRSYTNLEGSIRISQNGSGDLGKVFYKSSYLSLGASNNWLENVTEIDLSRLDISQVNIDNLSSIFQNAYKLKKVSGLETFDVSNVQNLSWLFQMSREGESMLEDISNLKDWKVDKVTYISRIFYNCCKLADISALKNWNTDKLKSASEAFCGCYALKDISPLKNWNTKSMEYVDYMFKNCPQLSNISPLYNWDVSNFKNANRMFAADKLINFVDLSKWDLKDECTVNNMFEVHDDDADQYPILVITKSKNLQDKDGTAEVYKNRKKVSKVILTLDNHEFKDGSRMKEFENTNVIYLPDDVWADLNGGEEEGKNISYELEEITNDGVYKIKASWPDMLNSDYDWPKVKTGLKYNGTAQELLDMSTLRLPDGCKLMYKFDDDVEWVEYDHENPNPPEKTKVGNYKIDLKIVGYNYKHVENSNNPIEVSIEEREEKEKEYGWNSINSGGGTINKTNETASNSSDKKNDTKKNESQSQEQPNNIAPKTISNLVLPEEIKTKKYAIGYDDKTFKPENKITRAEVARLIYNLIANNEKVSSESLDKFTDLEKNIWYGDAVAYLANKKIINGYENKFNQDSFITRAEMAQILFNVLKFYDSSSSLKYSYGLYEYNFIDLDTNHWANEAIKQLASNRIINGYEDKTFRPDQNITRAEAIVMISKTFKRDLSNINYDSKNKFFDLSESHWAFNYIMDAVE